MFIGYIWIYYNVAHFQTQKPCTNFRRRPIVPTKKMKDKTFILNISESHQHRMAPWIRLIPDSVSTCNKSCQYDMLGYIPCFLGIGHEQVPWLSAEKRCFNMLYIYNTHHGLKLCRPICILRPHVTSNFNIGSIW